MKINTVAIEKMKNKGFVEVNQKSVNNFKRLLAYFIDWYIASIVAGLPVILVYSIFFQDLKISQNIMLLPMPYSIILGVVAILFYAAYFVWIPLYVYPGQTPAKKLLNIKIVKKDGSDVDAKSLIKRELLGVMIIEGYIAASSSYFHQIINIIVGTNLNDYFIYVFGAITALSIIWAGISPQRRMIHDYIGGTMVIDLKES